MEGYRIGFGLLKQCLFGIGYCMGSWSVCIGPVSIEIHPHNFRHKCKWVSWYNEFSDDR